MQHTGSLMECSIIEWGYVYCLKTKLTPTYASSQCCCSAASRLLKRNQTFPTSHFHKVSVSQHGTWGTIPYDMNAHSFFNITRLFLLSAIALCRTNGGKLYVEGVPWLTKTKRRDPANGLWWSGYGVEVSRGKDDMHSKWDISLSVPPFRPSTITFSSGMTECEAIILTLSHSI